MYTRQLNNQQARKIQASQTGGATVIRFPQPAQTASHPRSLSEQLQRNPGALSQPALCRDWITAELEKALADDRFELYYQPLFDIQSQQTVGAEALVRLRAENGELISPDRFIPLTEELGFIVPLGRWILTEACQQLKLWQQQNGGPLRMAVNVSPVQLCDPEFVSTVRTAVESAGIAYSDLELEITEGHVVRYQQQVEQAFNELSALGVSIAIDDFGTGYSALAYLARMPWSRVKIDRSFLTDVPHQQKSRQVVLSILAMAEQLDLEVTAEGIETEAQYRFLVEAGCKTGQGFGYARPQPAAAFQRLLQANDNAGWSCGEPG
ncbi:MAG: EAL domain-containing protein [Gammaproteobacteria bacterium]|nr:EAL domain-containing protein [Gammaproteobacteria bacterium]